MDVFGQMFGALIAALIGSFRFNKRLEQERKRGVPDRDPWKWLRRSRTPPD